MGEQGRGLSFHFLGVLWKFWQNIGCCTPNPKDPQLQCISSVVLYLHLLVTFNPKVIFGKCIEQEYQKSIKNMCNSHMCNRLYFKIVAFIRILLQKCFILKSVTCIYYYTIK